MTKTLKHIVELVRWRSIEGTTDMQMTEAVNGILPDLKSLPGFVSQTLYKDDDGQWTDLYVWDTRKNAVASNDLMSNKPSFIKLMELIDITTVSIEFLNQP